MSRRFELRDPVHGFIELNVWERDIINQPAYQRLRRIKQLAWTDMVYPGASHTRFEHSLGVMHVATRLFDAIRAKNQGLLEELEYVNLDRQRQLVRLAALLHDVGHAPFSHAAEELLPVDPKSKRHFTHEQYSAAIVEHALRDVIEEHPFNKKNHSLRVKDLTDFFLDIPSRESVVLRDLVSGQMDADRMDYMLRDSHHIGVAYGRFDLDRLIATLTLVKRPDSDSYTVGIAEDGIHAAEALIIARYMLFTQVYFHKTRVIYDFHLAEALKEILKKSGGSFPSPLTKEDINEYLTWDDWKVYGALAESKEHHAVILRERKHYRLLRETPEVPRPEDEEWLQCCARQLEAHGITVVRRDASKSWYKFDNPADEILVDAQSGPEGARVVPLSTRSSAVRGLPPVRQSRLYVPQSQRQKAEDLFAA